MTGRGERDDNRGVDDETDGSASTPRRPESSLLHDLLSVLLPMVGLLVGGAIGWLALTWAVQAFREALEVPELSPIPVRDRAPGVPGPTVGYWLSWTVPFLTVYGTGALLWWRWRRCRLLTGSVLVGFSAVLLLLVPLWISIEIGGFAPDP